MFYSNTTLHVLAECLTCIYLMKGGNNPIAGLHSTLAIECKNLWLVKLSFPNSVPFRKKSFKKWWLHFLSKIILHIKASFLKWWWEKCWMRSRWMNDLALQWELFSRFLQQQRTKPTRYKISTSKISWFANYILYLNQESHKRMNA